jgi:ribosomal protein L10
MKIKNISNRKELQIKNLFDNYEFIAFVSYSNFNQDQIHKFKLFLSELGLSIKFIRNKRLKESLSDTRFKNMNRIFQGKVMLIYGEHDTETQKKLSDFFKDKPHFSLLGCLNHGKYFYTPSLINYVLDLPGLSQNQMDLCFEIMKPLTSYVNLLDLQGQQIESYLSHNGQQIVQYLDTK